MPAGHVYVRHLAPEDGVGPVRLPDPDPANVRRAATQRWWPPVMLDPAWVRDHDFDIMHLHFGFDSRSEDDLTAWVAALRDTGRPLVYTVHDLRNPHHLDRTVHDRQLDVLVPAADALVTLTAGAADEIRRRWGREATVLPHPHVVPLERHAGPRRDVPDRRFTVGLHLKSLRPSMAPDRVLPVLVETIRELRGAELRVDVHRDVMDHDGARHAPELAGWLRAQADAGDLLLEVHDYFTDQQLWDYLGALDVSVLPYRFGTHSGWLEACRDLGTTVVAPSCGYYAQQGPVLSYGHDEDHLDVDSLAGAVRTAHRERPELGATLHERREQRRLVSVAHDGLYRSLVGR